MTAYFIATFMFRIVNQDLYDRCEVVPSVLSMQMCTSAEAEKKIKAIKTRVIQFVIKTMCMIKQIIPLTGQTITRISTGGKITVIILQHFSDNYTTICSVLVESDSWYMNCTFRERFGGFFLSKRIVPVKWNRIWHWQETFSFRVNFCAWACVLCVCMCQEVLPVCGMYRCVGGWVSVTAFFSFALCMVLSVHFMILFACAVLLFSVNTVNRFSEY